MKVFENFFLIVFHWNKKKWGYKESPQYNALFGISFMNFLNILSVGIVFQYLGMNIFLRSETPRILILCTLLVILLLNYFRFIYKSKYVQLYKKFEQKLRSQRHRIIIAFWSYLVISFASVVVLALLLRT